MAVRNAARKSKVLRLEWVYTPTTKAHSMTLKVEVNVTERTPMNPVVTLPFAGLVATDPTVDVATYDINEMLGTKMRALRQRDKGRDLFDLAVAWQRSEAGTTPFRVAPVECAKAYRFYMAKEGSVATRADFTNDLRRKARLQAFRVDLRDVLAPEAKHDVDTALAIVEEHFLPHLE